MLQNSISQRKGNYNGSTQTEHSQHSDFSTCPTLLACACRLILLRFCPPCLQSGSVRIGAEKFKAEQNEKQGKERAEAEVQRQQAKLEADTKAKAEGEKTLNEALLDGCLADADTHYWSYVKLNGTEIPNKPGTYNAPTSVWDYADKQKKSALDECYRKYRP